MQTPLGGMTPNMVAVGESKIPGTNAVVQAAVPQDGVPVYFVPGALEPRDATGASEAIGGRTPMEQLLSEAFDEFEFEDPAKVHGSVDVERCPKKAVTMESFERRKV